MQTILIFVAIYGAMIATAFWEAYVEGRNPWDKRKSGWKLRFGKGFVLPAYHFYLFIITFPLLLTLPFMIYGWNTRLFGVVLSAYVTGLVLEDFTWFIVNPSVQLQEFWTDFTDYYPWIKINGKKIVPVGYILGVAIAVLSWCFLWR